MYGDTLSSRGVLFALKETRLAQSNQQQVWNGQSVLNLGEVRLHHLRCWNVGIYRTVGC
jgi:hypothetical protein